MPATAPPFEVDPRLTRTRETVLVAASDLLIEGGASWLTVERVVERSGVARSTIYRHWRTQPALVLDAFKALLAADRRRLLGGGPYHADVRETLMFLTGALANGLDHARWAPVIASVVELAERDAEMRSLVGVFLTEVRAVGRDALAAAVAQGELPAAIDIDLALDVLIAPLFYRRLLSGEPLDAGYAAKVVDLVLAGVA